MIPNEEKIVINQELILAGQQKILVKELVDRLLEAYRAMAKMENPQAQS